VPLWEWVVDAVGGALLLVVLSGLLLVFRRRWISRDGGTFELSHRVLRSRSTAATGRGWVLGVGRYSGDRLEFFRVFSLVPRPRRVLERGVIRYDGPREPAGGESYSLYAGHVIIGCRSVARPGGQSESFELAMSPDALTGFLAWLEASPPGTRPRPR
jgi:hypothetical protein